MLQKIREDQATLLVVLPVWPTQGWFPQVLELMEEAPLLLLKNTKI